MFNNFKSYEKKNWKSRKTAQKDLENLFSLSRFAIENKVYGTEMPEDNYLDLTGITAEKHYNTYKYIKKCIQTQTYYAYDPFDLSIIKKKLNEIIENL